MLAILFAAAGIAATAPGLESGAAISTGDIMPRVIAEHASGGAPPLAVSIPDKLVLLVMLDERNTRSRLTYAAPILSLVREIPASFPLGAVVPEVVILGTREQTTEKDLADWCASRDVHANFYWGLGLRAFEKDHPVRSTPAMWLVAPDGKVVWDFTDAQLRGIPLSNTVEHAHLAGMQLLIDRKVHGTEAATPTATRKASAGDVLTLPSVEQWTNATAAPDTHGKVVLVFLTSAELTGIYPRMKPLENLPQKLLAQYGAKGLVVVGLATTDDADAQPGAAAITKWTRDTGVTYPLGRGAAVNAWAETQSNGAFPAFWIVGRNGHLLAQVSSSPDAETKITSEIEKALLAP